MKKFRYYDKNNLYPSATLEWQGPGYYAGLCSGDHCTIQNVDHLIDENKSPYPMTYGTGFGSSLWADTPEQAAGNYADSDAQHKGRGCGPA